MTRLAYPYDEAAAQLGVSKDVLRDLIASGDVLAFPVSSHTGARSLRVSHAELERFIAKREEQQRQQHAHLTLGPKARNSA